MYDIRDDIHTIYDLIIYAYEQIKGRTENRILSQYFEKGTAFQKDITRLFREVMLCNLMVEEFVDAIREYCNQDMQQVCIHILFEFERYYKERDKYKLFRDEMHRNIRSYPIKSDISSSMGFYSMCLDNFVMDSVVMAEARTHRIRKGIWEHIVSYCVTEMVVSDNQIIVEMYDNRAIQDKLEQEGLLTIAVVPFSNQEAFDRDEGTGILKYKEYDQDEMDRMYFDCITLLSQLDAKNVDVVVFPEIVLQENIVSRIKTWLIQKAIMRTNLKLVFMGSYYVNDINQCVLFSGTGKRLLCNDKHQGFEYIDRDKHRHREALGDCSDVINLIDVKGLGRVWYQICKDALMFSDAVMVVERYGCSMQIISSYSTSISDFGSIGEALANRYQVFTVVCNSCAVRREKNIGIISWPVFEADEKKVDSNTLSYFCNDMCKNCQYSKCAHIFECHINEKMNFVKIEKSNNEKSIKHNLTGIQIIYNQLKI